MPRRTRGNTYFVMFSPTGLSDIKTVTAQQFKHLELRHVPDTTTNKPSDMYCHKYRKGYYIN